MCPEIANLQFSGVTKAIKIAILSNLEIASEIEKGAIALCEKYQCQFASHVKGSVSLNQMPLRVVANYCLEEAAQEQCKKSDARKAFCSRIRHIAENLKGNTAQ